MAQDNSVEGSASFDNGNGNSRDQDDDSNESPSKRRRVFLQTMGQQLREVGVGNDSRNGGSSNTLPGSIGAVLNDSPGREHRSGRQVHIQTPESDAVPGEDDQVSTMPSSANKALWRPGEVIVSSEIHDNNAFNFDDLVDWTRSYFDHWHPPFPFLHAPTVLKYFDKMTDPHSDLSPYELIILRSVSSISLADRRQTGNVQHPIPQHLVFTSLNDAIQSAQSLLVEESTILALQAIVSVQLFLISMLRYNAASRLEALASRMAFHLGLHRCPRQSRLFSTKDAELRQRIFWSMYSIDRYICIRLGIPLGIRDADVDTCFPTVERHTQGTAEIQSYDGRFDLVELLARHTKIRGNITELRNRSLTHKSTEHDEAITIEAEMTKWWNDVDELLENDESMTTAVSDYHRLVLIVSRYEAIIALNKHILATTKSEAAYNSALQNCITAARAIITTIHKAVDKGDCQDGQLPRDKDSIGLMWPSFTWAIWMSTFLVIYAANENQVKYDIAIRLANKALVILDRLAQRASLWPKACTVAIQDLKGQLISRRNKAKHTTSDKAAGQRVQAAANSRSGKRRRAEINGSQSIDTGERSASQSTGAPKDHQINSRLSASISTDQFAIPASDTFPIGALSTETITTTPPPPFVNHLGWMFSDNPPLSGDHSIAGFGSGVESFIDMSGQDIGMSQNVNGWNHNLWM